MKLNRELVIKKLSERITEIRAEHARATIDRAKKYDAAGKKVQAAAKQVAADLTNTRVDKLREALRQFDRHAPLDRGHYSNTNVHYTIQEIEDEITLLKLSTEESVTIRNNTALARYLTR